MSRLPIAGADPALDPDFRALVAGYRRIAVANLSGSVEILSKDDAADLTAGVQPLAVCHAPETGRRLGRKRLAALDLLELYAFTCPARFCHPTPRGLAQALDLESPTSIEDEARVLIEAVGELLFRLQSLKGQREGNRVAEIVHVMARANWGWAPLILKALDAETLSLDDLDADAAMHVWGRLSEWHDDHVPGEPGNQPVSAADARRRLAQLIGQDAEDRPQQGDYASAVTRAFATTEPADQPGVVLAEAGTGIGKTLGYLAPATLWAERNHDSVWISTFTRNLQRQIDEELDRLHPDPDIKQGRVVIRKGRENYLCLLNFREAVSEIGSNPSSAIALGLMARWIDVSRDGDIEGGDFPGWLIDLLGTQYTTQLTDRRGECIYSACDHYSRCFIEKTIRRARRADIVIANHALVLSQWARGRDERNNPGRLVFDEGHHLFDTADTTFAARLSGTECAALRQWLLGAEHRRLRRSQGLQRRLLDFAHRDERIQNALDEVTKAALLLPGPGWERRLEEGRGQNAGEAFLLELRKHIYNRSARPDSYYDLEITTADPSPGLVETAARLNEDLTRLVEPMRRLSDLLTTELNKNRGLLELSERSRIEGLVRSLETRVHEDLMVWKRMLADIAEHPPDDYVDWFSVSRNQGRDIDTGMHRHWLDPMKPFVETVVEPADGVVITSATLRDGTGDPEADWRSAEQRTGTIHLESSSFRAQVPSPFDYRALTRVLVVTDVNRDNTDDVANAYRQLFVAADGGALGLFTAITRLRAVHSRLAPVLEEAGLPLFAQHVDRMNLSSLISIFRAEERSCLLGTDAMRDGVDVPGRSLRLLVFDRLPWPRRTILHRARMAAHTAGSYDDLVIRLRLRQAFGRLVRRADDCGVFVMLDPRMSSRLAGAFPDGVEIVRTPLARAVEETREFLK